MVYVVEQGCYSSRAVVGVYATPGAAMAAHPPASAKSNAWNPARGHVSRPGGWQRDPHTSDELPSWSNGLDWVDAATITAYKLQT